MSILRDTIADHLREAIDGTDDIEAAARDLVEAVKDAVGEAAFAAATACGTAILTIENGVVDAAHVPAGVAVRVVDIDTDTDVADEIVHDHTHTGPIGSPWAALAVEERIDRLTGADATDADQPDIDERPYFGYGSGDDEYDEAAAQEAERAWAASAHAAPASENPETRLADLHAQIRDLSEQVEPVLLTALRDKVHAVVPDAMTISFYASEWDNGWFYRADAEVVCTDGTVLSWHEVVEDVADEPDVTDANGGLTETFLADLSEHFRPTAEQNGLRVDLVHLSAVTD